MQQISLLPVYTGVIPNKATQNDYDFANNIFGFINYSGNTLVPYFNDTITDLNILSGQINTKANEVENNAQIATSAFQNAANALALLNAGTIDNTVMAANKTYSNTEVNRLLSIIENKKANNIASATTTTIGTAGLGNYIHITGTTTIASLGVVAGAGVRRTLVFDGILTLTHNATNLICPGAENITTAPGMIIEVIAETTSTWRVVNITHPSVNMSELACLDGVASSIQSQLNGKLGVNDTAANANKLLGKNWIWSGLGGQPVWMWGTDGNTDLGLYNPSNFSVNYATSVSQAGAGVAVAGINAGDIGSECMMYYNGGSVGPNGDIAGSSLQFSSAKGDATGYYATGTWRCMGWMGTNSEAQKATIWKRRL